jgi:CheY-like chemotaxis protein
MTQKIFMIVDDDPDDREFFTDAVNMVFADSSCLMAVNGEDALRKLQHEISPLPDYIFLDLNMPRMDGRSCLSAMKRNSHLKNIPVIMFSTTSDPDEIEEAFKLGATHFVVKPVKLRTLCDELMTVTKNF